VDDDIMDYSDIMEGSDNIEGSEDTDGGYVTKDEDVRVLVKSTPE
jgi:hypothetical protein